MRGKINDLHSGVITLNEITPRGLIFIDTAIVESDGRFEFTGNLQEKTFCTINLPKGAVVLLLDSSSDITVSLDATNPDAYGVSGSAENEELRSVLQLNAKYMQQVKMIETRYAQYGDDVPSVEIQENIRNEYDSLMRKRTNDLEYLASNSSTLVALFITDFLMPEAGFDFLESIDRKMMPRYAGSKYSQELHAKVEKLKRTASGQVAPDIVLADPYGKTTTLSSLRGKYVLVDFWASWCRPCREESPRLVKVYNKYKPFGFDIFSVSLDDDREAWIKAINDDGLLWIHVSDLKKWNSDIVSLYNIESVPFTVLINREGVIIATNLRGEALEKKVDEAIRLGL